MKPGMSFADFADRAPKLPQATSPAARRHGTPGRLEDEGPGIPYPDGEGRGMPNRMIQENMIFCLECYAGKDGAPYGVKLEDQVLVTREAPSSSTPSRSRRSCCEPTARCRGFDLVIRNGEVALPTARHGRYRHCRRQIAASAAASPRVARSSMRPAASSCRWRDAHCHMDQQPWEGRETPTISAPARCRRCAAAPPPSSRSPCRCAPVGQRHRPTTTRGRGPRRTSTMLPPHCRRPDPRASDARAAAAHRRGLHLNQGST